MFDSQTIQMQGTTATTLYSPWFPRGGDFGLFTIEATSMGGTSLTLTAVLVHKNASDPGDGAPVDGNITDLKRSAVGRETIDFYNGRVNSGTPFGGFKELVRYKFTLSGGATSTTSWATFRMLPTTWYDKV